MKKARLTPRTLTLRLETLRDLEQVRGGANNDQQTTDILATVGPQTQWCAPSKSGPATCIPSQLGCDA